MACVITCDDRWMPSWFSVSATARLFTSDIRTKTTDQLARSLESGGMRSSQRRRRSIMILPTRFESSLWFQDFHATWNDLESRGIFSVKFPGCGNSFKNPRIWTLCPGISIFIKPWMNEWMNEWFIWYDSQWLDWNNNKYNTIKPIQYCTRPRLIVISQAIGIKEFRNLLVLAWICSTKQKIHM